jgi:precorrin-6B methylase 2
VDATTLASEMKRLGESVATFAALAAAIRRHLDSQPGHPETDAVLGAVAEAVLPGPIAPLDREALADILAGAMLQMAESHDLVKAPARAPGWSFPDADVLIAQGRLAAPHARQWVRLAKDRPQLAKALTGRLLDVGTGVAALALEAASLNPSLHIVAIDIYEPALEIARAAVRASPHAARIEIRHQDVTTLEQHGVYSLAWVPTSFLPRSVADEALRRVLAALAPGGFLVVGTRGGSGATLQHALASLRVLRSGGYPWLVDEMTDYLSTLGYVDIEAIPSSGRVDILARKPMPTELK